MVALLATAILSFAPFPHEDHSGSHHGGTSGIGSPDHDGSEMIGAGGTMIAGTAAEIVEMVHETGTSREGCYNARGDHGTDDFPSISSTQSTADLMPSSWNSYPHHAPQNHTLSLP